MPTILDQIKQAFGFSSDRAGRASLAPVSRWTEAKHPEAFDHIPIATRIRLGKLLATIVADPDRRPDDIAGQNYRNLMEGLANHAVLGQAEEPQISRVAVLNAVWRVVDALPAGAPRQAGARTLSDTVDTMILKPLVHTSAHFAPGLGQILNVDEGLLPSLNDASLLSNTSHNAFLDYCIEHHVRLSPVCRQRIDALQSHIDDANQEIIEERRLALRSRRAPEVVEAYVAIDGASEGIAHHADSASLYRGRSVKALLEDPAGRRALVNLGAARAAASRSLSFEDLKFATDLVQRAVTEFACHDLWQGSSLSRLQLGMVRGMSDHLRGATAGHWGVQELSRLHHVYLKEIGSFRDAGEIDAFRVQALGKGKPTGRAVPADYELKFAVAEALNRAGRETEEGSWDLLALGAGAQHHRWGVSEYRRAAPEPRDHAKKAARTVGYEVRDRVLESEFWWRMHRENPDMMRCLSRPGVAKIMDIFESDDPFVTDQDRSFSVFRFAAAHWDRLGAAGDAQAIQSVTELRQACDALARHDKREAQERDAERRADSDDLDPFVIPYPEPAEIGLTA